MNNQELERIELYAEGKLSPEEENALEQRMRDDGPYREWVNETLMLIKGVKQYGRAAFMTELKQWEKKAGKPAYLIPVIPRIYYYAAAVILLLITSVLTYRFISKPQTTQQLYAMFFEPYPNVVAPLTRDKDKTNDFSNAFQLYEEGRYHEALDQFGQVTAADGNEGIFFYKALSYMALNQTDSALVNLESIRDQGLHFKQQTYWYLALCYLKNDHIDSASNILTRLLKEYPDNKNSNALLQHINKLKNQNP